jgi:hypothetical protein
MPQIGSDERPVLMTNKKNKGRLYGPSDGGKGAAPRVNVHSQQYRDNWGKAGQWSARKAQLLAKEYKAKGGGYK